MLRNYASRHFLPMYITLWWADSLGLYAYWKIDMFSGPGNNTWEDSFCWSLLINKIIIKK